MTATQPAKTQQRWREWLTVAAISLTLGLAYSISGRMRRLLRGEAVDWGTLFSGEMLHFCAWILLYPCVAFLAVRHPLGERRSRPLLVHLAAAFAFSPVLMVVTEALLAVSGQRRGLGPAAFAREVLVPEYAWGMTAYLVLLSLASAIEWRRRDGRRALEDARLEAALALARLQALRTQLQPHFLFNALNSVSSLLRRDPDGAERMVARIGDFLRLVLDDTVPEKVTLGEEIAFLESYLDIERVRFRDRLGTRIEVPPELLDARVPSLILQPLFENSIRHGIGEHAGPGQVTLRAGTQRDRLRLAVEDDGARNCEGVLRSATGIGLANVRARLEQLYGSGAELCIGPAGERGVRVTIELPWERSAAEEGNRASP